MYCIHTFANLLFQFIGPICLALLILSSHQYPVQPLISHHFSPLFFSLETHIIHPSLHQFSFISDGWFTLALAFIALILIASASIARPSFFLISFSTINIHRIPIHFQIFIHFLSFSNPCTPHLLNLLYSFTDNPNLIRSFLNYISTLMGNIHTHLPIHFFDLSSLSTLHSPSPPPT